jgi:UPF0271 protein
MIPINVDCGEEVHDNQDKIIINNCQWINIACGGHAGNEATMTNCIKLAKEYNVKIGAHPSFLDKENFGRIQQDVKEELLVSIIKKQIFVLQEIADKYGEKLHHIKPHGALYNMACKSHKEASAVVQSILDLNDNTIKLCAPQSSLMSKYAELNGINVAYESFADRVYMNDGSLQSRTIVGAWFSDKYKIKDQWHSLNNGYVITSDHQRLELESDTICLHGEHHNILEIFNELNEK